MSKHQSTIKAYFHKLGESKKRPGSTDNTDDEYYSNTENKSPNKQMSAVISCEENQSQTKNKKLKVQDKKEVNEKSPCQSSLKAEKLENNVSNEKQFLSLCDKYKGALEENIGITWFENLEKEFEKPYFQKLNEFLLQVRIELTFLISGVDILKIPQYHYYISTMFTVFISLNRNEKITLFFHHTTKSGHGPSTFV